jgi:DNA-binding NtrC family response regulator
MFPDAGGLDVRAAGRECIPLAESGADRRKTVLLVTTDANLRVAAARTLEAAGYAVVTAAHSGHATLAALAGGRIDILASDLELDDMPGPALAARLRRQHPALRAVFFAGAGTSEDADLVIRPFTREEFLGAITALA